jgi:glutathione S-transferase
MKLYNHALAPNPRRVRIFAAEKGIELVLEDVDILAGQSRTTEFLAKNSSGGVPVLELDDGSYLSDSVAICWYLEGLHPEPNLLGRDLREQADIERWNCRMEFELFAAIGRTVQNTSPIFQGRFKQFPEYGEAQRAVVYSFALHAVRPGLPFDQEATLACRCCPRHCNIPSSMLVSCSPAMR